MSDDWVITPPCSPISNLNQKENSKDINDINCTYMLSKSRILKIKNFIH